MAPSSVPIPAGPRMMRATAATTIPRVDSDDPPGGLVRASLASSPTTLQKGKRSSACAPMMIAMYLFV